MARFGAAAMFKAYVALLVTGWALAVLYRAAHLPGRFMPVILLAALATPARAQADGWMVEPVTDYRDYVLTEQYLRDNEGYFFALFNNNSPAPFHDNTLLHSDEDFRLVVMQFSDGTLKLGYGWSGNGVARAFTDGPVVCAPGTFDVIQPWPWNGSFKLSRKERKRQMQGQPFPHTFRKVLIANSDKPACLQMGKGVALSYVHTYRISRDMRNVIRRWLWEKWGDQQRLAESR
jgi:hypothetical protein